MELMQLKQGNTTIAEYARKFDDLCRFSKICQGNPADFEEWKCLKFEGGHREDLMSSVVPLEIRNFAELVNKCKLVEECAKKAVWKGSWYQTLPNQNIYLLQLWGTGTLGEELPKKRLSRNPIRTQQQGQVFAMTADDAMQSDALIQGQCIVKDRFLTVLYDSGASHSFISLTVARELGLDFYELNFDLIVHTPASQNALTSLVCLQTGVIVRGTFC
ncbi:uncharacterized protein LOC110275716 [Arachis duranensis]|uniref:Uncharacterized protein LOC110275716 n=1 Tax=Arachis duranensis TaxID=130453 RepID=A0A9C6WCL5_ARADU|nr:uncharacterized protein LOC110275716 [Arachis duranensis]